MTKGCMLSSSTASFQSIFGWKATSQGYPRIILSSPISVTRNSHVLDFGSDSDLQVHIVGY
jgi:predicted nicotinamide N-methyase